jgi:hypothetical protein
MLLMNQLRLRSVRSHGRFERWTPRLVVICTLVFSGCATLNWPVSGPGWEATWDMTVSKDEPRGWVAASIGFEHFEDAAAPFHTHSVWFERLDGDSKRDDSWGRLQAMILGTQKAPSRSVDIVDGGLHLSIVSMPLRPGHYHISGGTMFSSGGTVSVTAYSGPGVSFPFEVRANEVTYLGRYVSRTTQYIGRRGWPVRTGGFFVVSDRWDEDRTYLAGKPAAPPANASVRVEVPDVGIHPSRFFVAEHLISQATSGVKAGEVTDESQDSSIH